MVLASNLLVGLLAGSPIQGRAINVGVAMAAAPMATRPEASSRAIIRAVEESMVS
jgi:hypothetical protein